MSGQRYPDCDPALVALLRDLTRAFAERCEDLRGVILHGSLAMGCYAPPKSDVDILVITEAPPSDRLGLLEELCDLEARRPMVGSIELSVIDAADAAQPVHPLPYSLHFGDAIAAGFACGREVLPEPGARDPDLAAHLMVARTRGIALFGPPPAELIGELPWSAYLDSVLADLRWLLNGENILDNPCYAVLNGCRAAQLMSGEQVVASKVEGAAWGLANLPAAQRPLIEKALAVYQSGAPVTPEARAQAGAPWDEAALLRLRDELRARLEAQSAAGSEQATRNPRPSSPPS